MKFANLLFHGIIHPLARKRKLVHNSILKHELILSMKRPVRIEKISDSLLRKYKKEPTSVMDSLEMVMQEFEQRRESGNLDSRNLSSRWKWCHPDFNDICNLYLSAIRTIALLDMDAASRLFQRVLNRRFDQRMLRTMVTFNNRMRNFNDSMDILSLMESTDWVKSNSKLISSTIAQIPTSKKNKTIKWVSEHNSATTLNHDSYELCSSIQDEYGYGYNWMQLAGRLYGDRINNQGAILVHFEFLDIYGNKIYSKHQNKQGEVVCRLEGLTYSSRVEWYKYLTPTNQGSFFIEFQVPTEAKLVILKFRTWKISEEAILDERLNLSRSIRMLPDERVKIHIRHLKSMFNDIEWKNLVDREVFRIMKETNLELAIQHGMACQNPEDIGFQKVLLNRLRNYGERSFFNRHLTNLVARAGENDVDENIFRMWKFKLEYDRAIHSCLEVPNGFKKTFQGILDENAEDVSVSNHLLDSIVNNGQVHYNDRVLEYCLELASLSKESGSYDYIAAVNESKILHQKGMISESISTLSPYSNSKNLKSKLHVYETMINILDKGYDQSYSSSNIVDYSSIGKTVLYLLHSSLPEHNSGYTCRSQGILSSMHSNTWKVIPCTRLGYPWNLNAFRGKPIVNVETVDGIDYYRLFQDGVAQYELSIIEYVNRYSDAIVEQAKLHRPSIIHASSNHLNGLAAASAARRLRINYIYEVRGFWEFTRVSRQPEWEESEAFKLYKFLEIEAAKSADMVLTLTNGMKNELISRGVSENKIKVFPNGVDSTRFQPLERDVVIEERFGLKEKVVIGYVGSIVDYEGLDLLLSVVSELMHIELPSFHVLIVGDGAYLNHVKKECDRLGLHDIVSFTGRVDVNQIESYYSVIDIAPFPRRSFQVTEIVSPLKPLEAMSSGKCVIVSDVAALTEMVEDGFTGVVFNSGDEKSLFAALKDCIVDEDKRLMLGNSARKWVVDNRDWRMLIDELESIYESALESVPPRGFINLKHMRLSKSKAEEKFEEFKNEGFAFRSDIPAWDLSLDELDFESNPFDDRNWRLQINSMRHIDPALWLGRYGDNQHFRFALEMMLKWIDCDERYGDYSDFRWNDMASGNRAVRLAFIYQNAKRHDFPTLVRSKLRDSIGKHLEKMMASSFLINEYSNHAVFTVHGVMALAVSCPESLFATEATSWATRRFEELLNIQFFDEGIHIENSPEYHFFMHNSFELFHDTGWYSLSEDFNSRIDCVKEAACWLVWPDLRTIPLGDTISTKLSYEWLSNRMNALDEKCEKLFLQNGKEYLEKHFVESGYTIIRSPFNTTGEEASMLFCTSAFNNTMHRHSDDLSFQLFESGREIFIDPGKFSYDHDNEFRKYVISTRSHNSLEIDGYNYPNTPKGDASYYETTHSFISEHPWGFTLRFGKRWEPFSTDQFRCYMYHPGEFLIVVDILNSEEEKEFRQRFQINEDFNECKLEDEFNLRANGNELSLSAQFLASNGLPQTISIHRGDENPINGWRCKSYKELTPVFSLSHLIKASECAMATGFSLTGGKVDLEIHFENRILSINGRINEIDIQFKELIRFPPVNDNHSSIDFGIN